MTEPNPMYVAVEKIVELALENYNLRQQVAELQAWKNAVPVQAIRDVNGNHAPIDDVIAGVDTVDAWLATLAQPEVQP